MKALWKLVLMSLLCTGVLSSLRGQQPGEPGLVPGCLPSQSPLHLSTQEEHLPGGDTVPVPLAFLLHHCPGVGPLPVRLGSSHLDRAPLCRSLDHYGQLDHFPGEIFVSTYFRDHHKLICRELRLATQNVKSFFLPLFLVSVNIELNIRSIKTR